MTHRLTGLAAVALCWVLTQPTPGLAASPPKAPADRSEVAAPTVSSEWGTRLRFHGWSADSQFVAYTRTRTLRAKRAGAAARVTTRHAHKKVVKGAFRGGAPRHGKDLAIWAHANGYVVKPIERSVLDDRRTWFVAPEGVYEFRLVIEKSLVWELLFEGEVVSRRAFDSLYVGIEPQLFLAPDRGHAVLVMHLDTGWLVDAAAYPIELPPVARTRWEALAPD